MIIDKANLVKRLAK